MADTVTVVGGVEAAETGKEVAMPFEAVTAVDVVPVGSSPNTSVPAIWAVNMTVAPDTGLPFASLTSAVRGLENTVP